MAKLTQLFNVYNKPSSSIELTEFDIYTKIDINSKKQIPVISSKTDDDGIFGFLPEPNIDISQYQENTLIVHENINYFINKTGCITVTKDGVYSGFMIVRTPEDYPIFSITGHATIISPLDNINLFWFKTKFQSLFMAHNSDGENNHFGKAIYNELDFKIPSQPQISLEYNLFNKLNYTLTKQIEAKHRLDGLLLKQLVNVVGTSYKINEVLDYIGRNDSLTELGIYLNQPKNNEVYINVLSGSGSVIGCISSSMENIKSINHKPILSVITRGRAGKLTYFDIGFYAGNTNTYPLFLKNEIKEQLNIKTLKDESLYLQFLKFYLEPIFLDLSSNSDLGVFPLNEIFNKTPLVLPFPQFDNNLVNTIECLTKVNDKVQQINLTIQKIKGLLDKEIIHSI